MNLAYSTQEPARAEVDELPGPTLLEFGNAWCGHCRAAQPRIAEAMHGHSRIRHIKIADGPGKPLGRSYRVKLWPTLIFLDGGKEVARLVRPQETQAIRDAIERIDAKDTRDG